MTVEHTTDTYPTEVSWQIQNSAGDTICAKDLNGATPTECCAPEGEYVVACADSMLDGWQGYTLSLSGVEVCGSFTSGSSKLDTFTFEGNIYLIFFFFFCLFPKPQ